MKAETKRFWETIWPEVAKQEFDNIHTRLVVRPYRTEEVLNAFSFWAVNVAVYRQAYQDAQIGLETYLEYCGIDDDYEGE